MITDQQVRKLMKLKEKEKNLSIAAAKAGMSENTARKYVRSGKLPSQSKKPRYWRTRDDPFEDIWDEIKEMLEESPGLEAKTVFEWLQRENPGKYGDGQIRTFQRRVKFWRATEGPAKEVFFIQKHMPGELCASDFTHMSRLRITIQGVHFKHLIYHFVLTYSNWETGTICFSESFESLSQGLQNALWELGGVPKSHRTDKLTTAVQQTGHPEGFTRNYYSLLKHYGLKGEKTQAGQAHENGDIEQRHHRFKRAVEQELLLRGSRDFESCQEYELFLQKMFKRLNVGRRKRFEEELSVLKGLPPRRVNDFTEIRVKVGPSSTIRVKKNVYSVHSRLIGEEVLVRLYADHLEVRYAQRKVDEMPRLMGSGKHSIQYRHIIDWLVRKPGAFENYRYRKDLFPSSHFRMAYDDLEEHSPARAHKEYIKILHLAARETETGVNDALRWLISNGQPINAKIVKAMVTTDRSIPPVTDVEVQVIDLCLYDNLLQVMEVQS